MKKHLANLALLKGTLLTLSLNLLLAGAAVAGIALAARIISGVPFSFLPATPTPAVIGYPHSSKTGERERAPSLEGPSLEGPSSEAASPEELLENQAAILAARRSYDAAHSQKELVSPPGSAGLLNMGEKHTFWVTNTEDGRQYHISAHLAYAGEHVYFWVEDELEYRWDDVYALAHTFDQEIFPRNRQLLGSERPHGVDSDQHIHILYTSHLASTTAGYYSSADAQPARLHHLSNQHDMIFLNAKKVDLRSDYIYGVLAHEFAHMIQWSADGDEEVWLTEGFSELAAFTNGYGLGTFVEEFAKETDTALTAWPGNDGNATPHYGASFLFVDYFWGRFGDQAMRDLVVHPQNGMSGIADVLDKNQARDPLTKRLLSTADLFLDWAVANLINRRGLSEGIYAYSNLDSLPEMQPAEKIVICPSSPLTRSVNQYGVDYVAVLCRGRYELEFAGTTQTPVFAENAHSGHYVFWSGNGDNLETSLTRSFDLTQTRPPLTLIYWTFFDIEKDNDFLNILISNDEGRTWQTLVPQSGQKLHAIPDGFDWGYSGKSNGGRWMQEKLDLSPYTGQRVSLQFRYVTDEVFSGTGFVLDDISLPEIGYAADFEKDDGGWQTDGFVRIINALPQNFRLALVRPGVLPGVVRLPLEVDNSLRMPLVVDDEVMLVITATNPIASIPAAYRFRVTAAAQ